MMNLKRIKSPAVFITLALTMLTFITACGSNKKLKEDIASDVSITISKVVYSEYENGNIDSPDIDAFFDTISEAVADTIIGSRY